MINDDFVSLDECLIHIERGQLAKANGTMHVMGPQQFKRLEKSIQHYLDTGKLRNGKYGLEKNTLCPKCKSEDIVYAAGFYDNQSFHCRSCEYIGKKEEFN